MLSRHFSRQCRSCEAPMARQEDTCWRCDANWVARDEPRMRLRVTPGGPLAQRQAARQARTPAPVARDARAASQARLDADRWIDEGGSLGAEAAAGY